ncbi:MAG: vitamin K epoxide reductase family protein [Candidatus Paceibacterota bacterium]
MLTIYLLIVAAALIGLTITINIYKKKHKKKVLVCPFGADCDSVITSDFSSFLGIGLEIYGMLYYGLIALSYSSLILFPNLQSEMTTFILAGASIGAFLFSLYLTFVQAFLIKTWCSWCLMSAGVSTSIFIFAMIGISIDGFSFVPILTEYKSYVTLLHLFGFALGVGGATISDVLFMRFLKDFKITVEEKSILQLMSQIVWIGLLIIVVSGIGLFLPESERLLDSAKFLTKMVVIAVVILNGAVLNLLITPKLLTIAWKENGIDVKHTSRMSNIAFASGAVSFISWYTAFFLGFANNVPYSFVQLISVYVGALLIGIIGSQLFKKVLQCKNSGKDNSTIVH